MEQGRKYTVVQHSGYGYGGQQGFRQGLEPIGIGGAAIERVAGAGGLLFDTYAEAHEFAVKEAWPQGAGLLPQAPGAYSSTQVAGLAVYIPRL